MLNEALLQKFEPVALKVYEFEYRQTKNKSKLSSFQVCQHSDACMKIENFHFGKLFTDRKLSINMLTDKVKGVIQVKCDVENTELSILTAPLAIPGPSKPQ